MHKPPIVTVVGSINMDLTVSTEAIPAQGETVLGNEFNTFPGGKGANQAVAASRLGANVNMVGAVGDDVFGQDLLSQLANENINTEAVHTLRNTSTGTATIILAEGDNRIIVAPGANGLVNPGIVEGHQEMIRESDMILLQLEVPLETISYVVEVASQYGVPIVLNPAPYQSLPETLLNKVSYITPNEGEAASLMAESNVRNDQLIVTKGSEGVLIFQNGEEHLIPAYDVKVKDTTGAGDTFNGALATYFARGCEIEKAVKFANASAALSTMKIGAQSGMPTTNEVEQFLKDR